MSGNGDAPLPRPGRRKPMKAFRLAAIADGPCPCGDRRTNPVGNGLYGLTRCGGCGAVQGADNRWRRIDGPTVTVVD